MHYISRSLRVLFIPLIIVFIFAQCRNQKPATTLPTITENNEVAHETAESDIAVNQNITDDLTSNALDIEFERTPIIQRVHHEIANSSVFASHFTGFCLYDPTQSKMVLSHNGEKYFTPASNIKILTLYTALKSFGQTLPGMLYRIDSDTLFIRPIGDPTFLHPEFANQPILEKLKSWNKTIAIEWPAEEINPYGIGWMWDDFNSKYMPELGWMPVYGNVVTFEYLRPNIKATPTLFTELVESKRVWNGSSNTVKRSFQYNFFTAEIRYPNWNFEKQVPFKYSKSLAVKLLENELGRTIDVINPRKNIMDTLYSQPLDSVLSIVMKDSDNFISEQLMIMAALKNGFSNVDEFQEHVLEKWFATPNSKWVDGSGLSRYNLVRPMDQVMLLEKIRQEYPWYRIHNLFAQGGISGTIKDWYANSSKENTLKEPYIIAKTGTLSNNHNISGYLQTRSGKLLVFSFMNNNFVRPTIEVKREMQKIFELIRDHY